MTTSHSARAVDRPPDPDATTPGAGPVRPWAVVAAAASLMALGLGMRSTLGLFVSPLNTASGLGLAALSLAMAIGQLAVGFTQPLVGHWSDRRGPAGACAAGGLLLAACTVLPALQPQAVVVFAALVAHAVAVGVMASNGPLLGAVNRSVSPARAGLAAGLISAGGSIGQLIGGPLATLALPSLGWQGAMLAMAALCLLALPLSRLLPATARPAPRDARAPVADVLRDFRFWCVAGSFGACGFHIAFLAVHMPGVIERCGLPAQLAGSWIALCGAANVAGSLAVGAAMRRQPSAALLCGLYLARAASVVAVLLLPVSASVMSGFAIAMGLTHMATLPPTARLLSEHHGAHRLGTVFGLAMLVHQVGAFAGVWLGGWAAEATGDDRLLWCIDTALALLAAALARGSMRPRAGAAFRTMRAWPRSSMAWRSSRRSAFAPLTTASASRTPSAAAARRW